MIAHVRAQLGAYDEMEVERVIWKLLGRSLIVMLGSRCSREGRPPVLALTNKGLDGFIQ